MPTLSALFLLSGGSGFEHACGLQSDASIRCWGLDNGGFYEIADVMLYDDCNGMMCESPNNWVSYVVPGLQDCAVYVDG